jgi:NitT/TauT family transport system ATP-binding protein
VDCVTRNQLHGFLTSIWQKTGKTIIFVTHNIDEAVYLSERIIFLSQRPAKVERDIEIDIPYPRNRTGRREQEKRGEILKLMEEYSPDLAWSA